VLLASCPHTSKTPFQLIYLDAWGPAPIQSSLGHKYFIIFVDDYTRYTWIYFLKAKNEVPSIFLQFEVMIRRQFNKKIKAFHFDWDGEYQRLHTYFKHTGIIHRIACPYTHAQNGTAQAFG
jgi:hypothetical protein